MSIAVPDWLLELGAPIGRADHPLKDLIAEAIEELGPKDREAIDMYYFEGLTLAEVAAHFNLAGKQSGQYRVWSATQRLGVILQEKGLTDATTRSRSDLR